MFTQGRYLMSTSSLRDIVVPNTLANFLERKTQLYDQGATVRRIGQYVRNQWRWVRAGVMISDEPSHIRALINSHQQPLGHLFRLCAYRCRIASPPTLFCFLLLCFRSSFDISRLPFICSTSFCPIDLLLSLLLSLYSLVIFVLVPLRVFLFLLSRLKLPVRCLDSS